MLLRLGPFEIDVDGRVLRRKAERVMLQPLALELLVLLAERAGDRVASSWLHQRLWPDTVVTPHSLDQLVHRVRVALGEHRDWLVTFPGRGYGLYARVVPVHDGTMHAIRPPERPLVGRDEVLDQLADAIRAHRLVTLIGTAGVGKTTVLRAFAHREGTAVWVDVEGVRSDDEVRARLLAALGRPELDPSVALATLAGSGPLLVVLDTCESWTGAAVVADWSREAPEARWLVGSRIAVGLPFEHRVALEPLSPEAALELFQQRCEHTAPEDLQQALTRAGGVPLAIELLAARPEDVPAADGQLDPLARSLEASWRWLTSSNVAALEQLSAFRVGFTFDDAAALLGPGAVGELDRLLDHSLIHPLPDGSLTVYALVRTHALTRCAAERREEVRDRHAAHVIGRMDRRELERAEVPEAMEATWTAIERGDVVGALDRLDETVGRLGTLYALEPLVEAATALTLTPEQVAPVWRHVARTRLFRGDHESARAPLARARATMSPGDAAFDLLLTNDEMLLHRLAREMDAETAVAERRLALLRAAGDPEEVLVLCTLAENLTERGDLRGGAALVEEALGRARSFGDPVLIDRCRGPLGIALMRLGRHAEAVPHLRAAADARAGQPVHQAYWVAWLGEAHAEVGEIEEGLALLDRSGAAMRDAGVAAGFGAMVVHRARWLVRIGRLE
ncbi:MAG: winged helix-turn-helix domain-containing protein, partial [Alphaproteobacteria bacterium]|nr:winged helix-turn-helix domain-containing protein [Alphaproteobacteria bacterium]